MKLGIVRVFHVCSLVLLLAQASSQHKLLKIAAAAALFRGGPMIPLPIRFKVPQQTKVIHYPVRVPVHIPVHHHTQQVKIVHVPVHHYTHHEQHHMHHPVHHHHVENHMGHSDDSYGGYEMGHGGNDGGYGYGGQIQYAY